MSAERYARKAAWLLPTVLAICALMVLPGGALLSPGHSDSNAFVAAGSSPTSVPASAGIAALPTPSSFPAGGTVAGSSAASASGDDLAASLLQVAPKTHGFESTLDTLADQIASGEVAPASVYLPNLAALQGSPRSGVPVAPSYTAFPAPMGLADFGLGASGPYAYGATSFAGSLTLNASNATYPGASDFITPPAFTNGSYNSPYVFGVQLNTVLWNISIPGTDNATFWTQNVVAINGNSLQFEDNVWNFSATGALNPGTLYSYNGTPVYPTFYYDYGPVITLTFPVTIELFNNVSIVNNRDQVTFGYRVVDSAGTFSGVYDTVVFNNPSAPVYAPPNPPVFEVDGSQYTPLGSLLYDAELVFGGPGGGSNAVFTALNGSLNLSYLSPFTSGWNTIPSAYDFGADTGETAVGVSTTWNPGGTEQVTAGPSNLYGLWNSIPYTSVPSGSIEFTGTVSPDYAFLFVGNTASNASYVPTNASGAFDTYLPPLGANFHTYTWRALADGSSPGSGSILGGERETITLDASPGTWNSPLYMTGNSQAEEMATALEGWSSGPYQFSGITVALDLAFTSLNDWGYISFNLFQATDVTNLLNVSYVLEGANLGPNTIYTMDGTYPGAAHGFLSPAPVITLSLEQYSDQLVFYGDPQTGVGPQKVTGTFAGTPLTAALPEAYYNLNVGGGGIVAWASPDFRVYGLTSTTGSPGAYVAASPNPVFTNGYSYIGATLLTLVDSNHARAYELYATSSVVWCDLLGCQNEYDLGAEDFGTVGGVFNNMVALSGAYGYVGFGSVDPTINDSLIEYASFNITGMAGYPIGAYLSGVTGAHVNDTIIPWTGIGAAALDSTGTVVTNLDLDAYGHAAYAAYVDGSTGTSFTNVTVDDVTGTPAVYGLFITDSTWTNVTQAVFLDDDDGIQVADSTDTTFQGLVLNDVGDGADVVDSNFTSFSDVFENDSAVGVEGLDLSFTSFTEVSLNATDLLGVDLEDTAATTITGLVVSGTTGIQVQDSSDVTASDITALYGAEQGLGLYDVTDATVTDVSASGGSLGVYLEGSNSISVATVYASGDSVGVWSLTTTGITVTGVTAADVSLGFVGYEDATGTVTGTVAQDFALGVALVASNTFTVATTAANGSAIGVFVYLSYSVTVTDVIATNTAISEPWASQDLWSGTLHTDFGVYSDLSVDIEMSTPIAAVDTGLDAQTSVYGIAATDYPAALYDYDSGNGDAAPGSLYVTEVNASGGYYGLVLNETNDGWFSGITTYQAWLGIWVNDGSWDSFTLDDFVGDASYGISLWGGEYNWVWDNTFIGNNGATGTYNPDHIQAYSGYSEEGYNFFNNPVCSSPFDCSYGTIGNYWSDWHTYSSPGVLAPYFVADETWDWYPLDEPADLVNVLFYATGLTGGVNWSVTLNGQTESTVGPYLVFGLAPGIYLYSVPAVNGYSVSPPSGSLSTETGPVAVTLTFTAVYSVNITESGLPAATSWSAIVGGQSVTGTTATLSVSRPAGTYAYQILPVGGYTAAPSSGSLTVVASDYALAVTFTAVTYAVTITESGLASGVAWSATVDGNTQGSTGTIIVFQLTNGTYTVSIAPVSGYTVSNPTIPLTVSGAPTGASVTFSPSAAPSYSVDVTQSGLASGTAWTAIVGGRTVTGTSATLSVTLPAGTYDFQITPVAGFTASPSSGSVTVATNNYSLAVTFTQVTYLVTVTQSGLTGGVAWSATVNGNTQTSTGAAITFDLANGAYTVAIGSVSGYTPSNSTLSVTVNGAPAGASVTYTPNSTPAVVSPNTFDTWLGVAIAIAVIALIAGLVALLVIRRRDASAAATPGTGQGTTSGDPIEGDDGPGSSSG